MVVPIRRETPARSMPPRGYKQGRQEWVPGSDQVCSGDISVAQIVAIGFRDDLPTVGQFHCHQVVGEIARWQLAADLDEGGLLVRAVDGDDEILARLAFRLRRGPLADAVE